ncbi:hypothetical protein Prudu_010557, partial [Prunus dulcis]
MRVKTNSSISTYDIKKAQFLRRTKSSFLSINLYSDRIRKAIDYRRTSKWTGCLELIALLYEPLLVCMGK